jgi:hypothetical protein
VALQVLHVWLGVIQCQKSGFRESSSVCCMIDSTDHELVCALLLLCLRFKPARAAHESAACCGSGGNEAWSCAQPAGTQTENAKDELVGDASRNEQKATTTTTTTTTTKPSHHKQDFSPCVSHFALLLSLSSQPQPEPISLFLSLSLSLLSLSLSLCSLSLSTCSLSLSFSPCLCSLY